MTINEACEHYLSYVQNTKNLSPLTVKAYRQDLNLLSLFLSKEACIDSIDRIDIRKIVDILFAKGQSRPTVKRRLACYKSMFSWLENEGIVEQTPFHKLDLKIKLPMRLPRNLSTSELKKLRDTAVENMAFDLTRKRNIMFNSIPRKTINHFTTLVGIELLLTTGLRVSELTNIRVDDIHLSERYIHIRGKGDRERRVFITTENIQNLVETYLRVRQSMAVDHKVFLINKNAKPATPQTFRLWVAALCKKANLTRKATPHMYRHSAATSLLEAGVDIRYVQKLLGHQSITTTQLYTHVNNAELYKTIVEANVHGRFL